MAIPPECLPYKKQIIAISLVIVVICIVGAICSVTIPNSLARGPIQYSFNGNTLIINKFYQQKIEIKPNTQVSYIDDPIQVQKRVNGYESDSRYIGMFLIGGNKGASYLNIRHFSQPYIKIVNTDGISYLNQEDSLKTDLLFSEILTKKQVLA